MSVTVVVPCYNYGVYLPACISSVLDDQPGVDVRVLVVDDASPDGSAEVAHRLAAGNPRVSVIAHEENRGHIATYNEGLAVVDSELVALLSADDLLTPGALTRAAELFSSDPTIAMVYGRALDFEGAPPSPLSPVADSWAVWSGAEWLTTVCRLGTNPIASPEVVLRTSAQRAIGGYTPDLPHSGDLEMWLRAAAFGRVGKVLGPVQALRRVHGGNMSLNEFAAPLADARERARAFESFFDGPGRTLSGARLLERTARHSLASDILARTARAAGQRGAPPDLIEQGLTLAREVDPRVSRLPGYAELLMQRKVAERLSPAWRPVARGFRAARGLRRRVIEHRSPV